MTTHLTFKPGWIAVYFKKENYLTHMIVSAHRYHVVVWDGINPKSNIKLFKKDIEATFKPNKYGELL